MSVLLLIVVIVVLAALGAPLFALIAAIAYLALRPIEVESTVLAVEFFRLAEMPVLIAIPLFTLAGALAGLSGYLWAAQTGFVNPELMGFHMSAHAIMMVILGGMGNFAGAIVGAFTFEYVLHLFKDLPTIGQVHLGKHWQLWMGSFIVLVVVFAPRGVLGLVQALTGGRRKDVDSND